MENMTCYQKIFKKHEQKIKNKTEFCNKYSLWKVLFSTHDIWIIAKCRDKIKTPWKYFWYYFNTGNRKFIWHGKGVFDWFICKPHLHVQVVMFWVNTRNSSHFAREPRKCNIFRQKGYPPRWMNLQESTFGMWH